MTAPVPSLVYTRIHHARRAPVEHAFAYRSLTWLVDVDDLPVLPRGLRWAARFRADDHFPEESWPGQTLRGRLDAHLADVGAPAIDGRVTALLSPRVAGYVFNPLSVFWCHDRVGRLRCVIAEVHNTYGGRHCYLVYPDVRGRAEVDKQFYVSPFNDVSGRYRLAVPEPDDTGRVRVAIALDRPGQPPFTATLRGAARPATTRAVLRAQLRAPLAPWLVALRIRVHGIRLWARGLHIHPRPRPSVPTRKGHVR